MIINIYIDTPNAFISDKHIVGIAKKKNPVLERATFTIVSINSILRSEGDFRFFVKEFSSYRSSSQVLPLNNSIFIFHTRHISDLVYS